MGESAAPRAQPERQRHHARQWLTRRRVLGMLRLALLPFFLFEVGIRLVPPDAVQVTSTAWGVSGYGPTGVGPTITQTVTDPREIARVRDAISAGLTSQVAWFPGPVICNGGFGESVTYRFTWHGIPVEEATSRSTNCGDMVILAVSSGGVTDPFRYQVESPPLVPPLN